MPASTPSIDHDATPSSTQDVVARASEGGGYQLGFGPLGVVPRETRPRPSNVARALLEVADVTPTGYKVGLFLAGRVRYAIPADVRRKVTPGEIFTYWPEAKIAKALKCSVRQVQRGVRSLREAGVVAVRRRVRPCEASYVWIGTGVISDRPCVGSGVGSHTEPRTEPQENYVPASPTSKRQRRIDGMVASCEISSRILGHEFDADEHLERLKHGTLSLPEMQAFTSMLKVERDERRHHVRL